MVETDRQSSRTKNRVYSASDRIRRRRAHMLLLAGILVLAGTFRLYGISDRGVWEYDEAWYLLEAKSLFDAGGYAVDRLSGAFSASGPEAVGLKDYLRERGTVPVTAFKPGHDLLILIAFVLLGVHDTSALLVSALLGTLTVLVTYGIGKQVIGKRAGVIAALLLAASAFHIGYSRSVYAQADSVFFVSLGTWLYLRSFEDATRSRRRRYLGGLSIGYGFTCHFIVGLVPMFIGLFEAMRWVLAKRSRSVTTHAETSSVPPALLAAGMATAPLMFELPGRLLKISGLGPEGFLTYFDQYLFRGGSRVLNVGVHGLGAVVERFSQTEGWAMVLLVLLGMWFVALGIRTRPIQNGLVLGVGFITLSFWLFVTKGDAVRFRAFAVALPFCCVWAGVALDAFWERFTFWLPSLRKAAPVAAICLVCAVVTNGVVRARDLLEARSGYREATDKLLAYVSDHGGVIGFTPGSSWPIWNFYLSARYDDLPVELRKRIRFYAQKDDHAPVGDYEPVDFLRFHRGVHIGDTRLLTYLDGLRQRCEPIVAVENSAANVPAHFKESTSDLLTRTRNQLSEYPQADRIEIFDLREIGPRAMRGEDRFGI